MRKQAATAHVARGTPLPGRWHVYPEMAAAGLWTTPTDLAMLGAEIQRSLTGESDFLPRDFAEQMVTPGLGDVGIGFFLATEEETMQFWHNGVDEDSSW